MIRQTESLKPNQKMKPNNRSRVSTQSRIACGLTAVTSATLALSSTIVHAQIYIVASYAFAIAIVILAPKQYWLAGGISIALLNPITYFPVPDALQYAPPALMPVILYMAIAVRQNRPQRKAIAAFGVSLVLYCLLLIPFGSSSNTARKIFWTIAIGLLCWAATVVADRVSIQNLWTMLCICGAALSVFAVVEFTTEQNFLESIYAADVTNLTQKWGEYRILTTLGHPLVNGTFFAVFSVMLIGKLSKNISFLYLPILALSCAAAVLTGSRSAIVAIAAGAVAVCLLSAWQKRFRGIIVAVGLFSIATICLLYIDNPLIGRNATSEGRGSANLRQGYFDLVARLLETSDYLGTGPGLSAFALAKVGGAASRYPIESSAVQIAASLGVAGAFLVLALLLSIAMDWSQNGAVVGVAGLAAYLTAASGFNLFEAYPALIILPVFILLIGNSEADINFSDIAETDHTENTFSITAPKSQHYATEAY